MGKKRRGHDGGSQHGGGKQARITDDAHPPSQPSASNLLSRTSSTTRAHLTSAKFSSLGLSAPTARAVSEVLCYETMTLVQEATMPVIMKGRDVIAKAKTGTGKTIGFLLPTIERLAGGPRGIAALAISPTRELASQIQAECEQLITFHKPALSSFVVVGGTNVHADVSRLAARPPSVLVATPGRLKDLLLNHGLASKMAGLRTLIFDEADQLLSMGFRPDIEAILAALAPSAPKRQTLLFSATLPKDVCAIAKVATRDAQLIDTVGEEDNTHAHVDQSVTVTNLGTQSAELLGLLQRLRREPHKIVVFFTTARLTQ